MAFSPISECLVPSHQHAQQPTEVGSVDALITAARELRASVDALRREMVDAESGPRGRYQRALCDLAVYQLREVGDHLKQLREQFTPSDEDFAPPIDERPGLPELASTIGDDDQLGRLRAGSAEWNLVTDEVTWSPEMFQIFGRNPAEGPLTLDELPAWLFAEDQQPVAALVTACLVDGSPIDGEFRVVRCDGSVRTVHLVGEPIFDSDGSTLAMWAVVRDVSDLRRSQRALRQTRDSLRHSRPAAESEQRLALELQAAVLPAWRGPRHFPRQGPRTLELAACHLPSDNSAMSGSDWYDALELPDGSALLTVGDLVGQGIAVASGTAMLLGALRGMAMAGVDPAPMLLWLNQLLRRSTQSAMNSALCCRFDPHKLTLSWAQAGETAPLLYRNGGAHALEPPMGRLLGGATDLRCMQRSHQLAPGDVVILHTDGLVPRRGHDTTRAGARRMTALSPKIARAGSAEECVQLVVEEFGCAERDEDASILAARIC